MHVDKRARGRTTPALWRWMKRRAAVEPSIGHLKMEHRLERNRLKGVASDALNAILSAAAMNFQKLLGAFWLYFLHPLSDARGRFHEHTGEMLYKTDRRHGLHHGGEQLAFPALASRMKMRLCLGKRLEPWINACSFYRAIRRKKCP